MYYVARTMALVSWKAAGLEIEIWEMAEWLNFERKCEPSELVRKKRRAKAHNKEDNMDVQGMGRLAGP